MGKTLREFINTRLENVSLVNDEKPGVEGTVLARFADKDLSDSLTLREVMFSLSEGLEIMIDYIEMEHPESIKSEFTQDGLDNLTEDMKSVAKLQELANKVRDAVIQTAAV